MSTPSFWDYIIHLWVYFSHIYWTIKLTKHLLFPLNGYWWCSYWSWIWYCWVGAVSQHFTGSVFLVSLLLWFCLYSHIQPLTHRINIYFQSHFICYHYYFCLFLIELYRRHLGYWERAKGWNTPFQHWGYSVIFYRELVWAVFFGLGSLWAVRPILYSWTL